MVFYSTDHKQKSHYALQKPKDSGVGIDGRKRLQAVCITRNAFCVLSCKQFVVWVIDTCKNPVN